MYPHRHNPHLRLTPAENQAARQAAARFIDACADYRALLAGQGLPLVADYTQLHALCGAHSELIGGIGLALTELEFDRLVSLKYWPNGLPHLSLPELACHYGLHFGRLLDAYTVAGFLPQPAAPCQCPGCLPSIPPDPATATPAALAAHAQHLRRLAAIGCLPAPDFHPYPQAPAPASGHPAPW